MYGGVDLGNEEVGDATTTTGFAWFVANYPEKFMAATIEELFAIDKLSVAQVKGTMDIYYYTCACMYHTQQEDITGSKKNSIVNVVEIETPGKITVYKENSDGSITSKVVDISDFNTASTVYKKLKKSEGEENPTFTVDDHERIKTNISMVAYSAAQEPYGSETPYYDANASDGLNSVENVLKYYWWSKSVYKYVMESGLLDTSFQNKGIIGLYAEKTHTKFLEEVEKMLETPILEKQTTTTNPTVEYKDSKAYIGPFKVKCIGGTTSLTINGKAVNWVTKTNGTYSAEQSGDTLLSTKDTSGNVLATKEFYVVLDEATAKNLSNIRVDIKLNYTYWKARMAMMKNDHLAGQCLMFHEGEEKTGTLSDYWTVEQTKKLTIQKQDSSGSALKVSGIKFEIYDSSNTKVGTLTTGSDGKTTSTVALKKGTTYTLKETYNGAYGYKNAGMSGATISSGGTISSQSATSVSFSLTADSTIYIKNTPELGNLTILKQDEDGTPMEGVEFVLWKGSGYLKLNDASVTTPIVTKDEGIDIRTYTSATIVDSAEKATKFKTNANGKIVINNLEIYSAKNTKYTYWITETANDHYGYNNMTMTTSNVTVTGGTKEEVRENTREIKVTLGTTTTVTIKNKQELAKLIINKKDENNEALKDIEFTIWQTGTGAGGWLKLDEESVTTPIVTTDEGIDITEYEVTYVQTIEEATKFQTNENGKIVIYNLERYSGKNAEYLYWVRETANNYYGYKGMVMGDTDITVTGGAVEELREETKEIKVNMDSDTVEVTIINTPYLGDLEVTKVDKDDTTITLPNVEFNIIIDGSKYLQLIQNEEPVESVTGTATINEDNVSNDTEYSVQYVEDKSAATIFISDSEGKLSVKNLEVYSGRGTDNGATKYTYMLAELGNSNYGYTIDTSDIENVEIKLVSGESTSRQVTNEQFLAGLTITKVDEFNEGIVLKDVEFVLSIDKAENTYVALYQGDELIKEVRGTATVNVDNSDAEDEYKIDYITLDKPYLEYTEEERENLEITIFKTDDNGQILIENLEVKNNTSNVNYTYRLTETYNPHYGYEELDGTKYYYETQLTKGEIASLGYNMVNTQEKIKISGYVWVENPAGKSNEYDGVYTEGDLGTDIKLKDLYIIEDGKLVKNPDASVPVEIKLRDKTTGDFIKTQPDEFDNETGKYTFVDVELGNDEEEKLTNYEVVFYYDGFFYTTLIPELDQDNGSKVKEVESERTEVNNKFATVKDNCEVITTDGETNHAIYSETNGHTSTVLGFDPEGLTTLTANTTETGINLKDKFDNLKTNSDEPVAGIDNINMGLALREQPKLLVTSDIYSAEVGVNGYDYTYYYNTRKDHYENLNGDQVGVQFEQETSTKRYTETVYSSDVDALKENRTTMNVSIIYKIQITNQARTLTSIVREISNYFDADYTIEEIGLGLDQNTITNRLYDKNDETINNSMPITENVDFTYADGLTPDEGKSYNSVRIALGDSGMTLTAGESKDVYIRFSINQDAIIGLLNGDSTYHNATEIMSYSSYYGDSTGRFPDSNNELEYVITEQRNAGEIYAGIDRTSQPGNIKLELIEDSRNDGTIEDPTPILNTAYFEDDTNSAPALLLELVESRQISGTIWEDLDTGERAEQGERIGNGYIDSYEKSILGVTVSLYQVDEDGNVQDEVAKYSNGEPATAVTNKYGEYTLGGYEEDEDGNVVNTYGVLPGRYVIKYTYENDVSYIVTDPNDLNQNKAINVNDYKSTVITSDIVKGAFEEYDNTDLTYPKRWYLEQEQYRYSDARDYIELRNDMEPNTVVTNSTYESLVAAGDTMIAHTPYMDIGIEYTEDDEADVINTQFVNKLENMDFGIIERPNIKITIEKEITGLEITTQTGASIVPQGNPTNSTMQYVKRLVRPSDGSKIISAEIETKILQGAQLNIEYTINVTNESETDYIDEEYYYYGTGGTTLRNVRVTKIVDYLDGTLTLEDEGQEKWQETTVEELQAQGLVSQETVDAMEESSADFTVLVTTDEYNEDDELKVYATKYIAVSDLIVESNAAEILVLEGGRTAKESIPGNYVPTESPVSEPDDDRVDLIITPPTGTTVNYTLYIIAAVMTFMILVSGIIIIKKKIIK